jgi:hypothetical protein
MEATSQAQAEQNEALQIQVAELKQATERACFLKLL